MGKKVDFVRIDFMRIDLVGVDLVRIDLVGVSHVMHCKINNISVCVQLQSHYRYPDVTS